MSTPHQTTVRLIAHKTDTRLAEPLRIEIEVSHDLPTAVVMNHALAALDRALGHVPQPTTDQLVDCVNRVLNQRLA